MAIFVVNFLLIFMWDVLLIQNNPSDGKKKAFCTISAIQWILISGLRDVDLSRDVSINYVRAFEETKTMSWSQIFDTIGEYLFNGLTVKDPGYTLLMKVFQIFSNNFQLFLIFIAIVFTTTMAVWIYKYSAMPGMSFLIYSSLFYSFFALTGLRQTIATALIVFIADKYVRERKFFSFAIFAFIAFLIHKSSIVYIVYFFVAGMSITPVYLLFSSGIIAVISVMGKALYAPIANILGFGDEVISNDRHSATTYAFLMLAICFVAYILYPWISRRRQDSKFMYNMLLLTILSNFLVIQNQSFMRIQQYFALVIMIIIPEMVLSIRKEYRPAIYFGAIGFMFFYLIYNNPQYRFFWQ